MEFLTTIYPDRILVIYKLDYVFDSEKNNGKQLVSHTYGTPGRNILFLSYTRKEIITRKSENKFKQSNKNGILNQKTVRIGIKSNKSRFFNIIPESH